MECEQVTELYPIEVKLTVDGQDCYVVGSVDRQLWSSKRKGDRDRALNAAFGAISDGIIRFFANGCRDPKSVDPETGEITYEDA